MKIILLILLNTSTLYSQEESKTIYYKNVNSEWIREVDFETNEFYNAQNQLISELKKGNFLSTESKNTYNSKGLLTKKSIYSSSNQTPIVFEYFYNNKNLLELEVNVAMKMKFKYTYDNQNQLIKKEFVNAKNQIEEIFYYSYQLDSNKEKTVVEMNYTPSQNKTSHIISTYNEWNLLISETRIGSIKNENNGFKSAYYHSEYIYKYDEQNRWIIKTCIVNKIPVSEFHRTFKKSYKFIFS